MVWKWTDRGIAKEGTMEYSAAPGASFTTEASDEGFHSSCFGGGGDRSQRSRGGEWEEID